MNRILIPPKAVTEVRTSPVDFSPFCTAGQLLSTVTVAVSVYSGTDATPPTFTATVSGQVVNVLETGGLLGVIYMVKISAVTSGSNTLVVAYYLALIPDLP